MFQPKIIAQSVVVFCCIIDQKKKIHARLKTGIQLFDIDRFNNLFIYLHH